MQPRRSMFQPSQVNVTEDFKAWKGKGTSHHITTTHEINGTSIGHLIIIVFNRKHENTNWSLVTSSWGASHWAPICFSDLNENNLPKLLYSDNRVTLECSEKYMNCFKACFLMVVYQKKSFWAPHDPQFQLQPQCQNWFKNVSCL